MACVYPANSNNFVRWQKVSGTLTLADLQASGLPAQCDFTKIDPVNDLAATAIDTDQITLTWTSDIEDSTFDIYRSATSGSGFTLLVAGVFGQTYTDTGLTPDTTYYYKLISKFRNLVSEFSNEANATTFNSFTLQVTTSNTGASSNSQFTLPFIATGTYNCVVNWGDGNEDTITVHNAAATQHTYSASGTYTIKIRGTIQGWSFDNTPNDQDPEKLIDISRWGDFQPISASVFNGCANLDVTATDVIDLSQTTTLNTFFGECSSMTFNTSVDSWDVSGITDLSSCFAACTLFNRSIDSWDVSSVTTLFDTFRDAVAFNQSLNSWNTSAVTSLRGTFDTATAFNGNITSWDTSSVTTLRQCFFAASAFNQDIGSWDVGSVTSLQAAFRNATSFNQDISSWDVSGVTTMLQAFNGATSFNQNLTAWTTTALTNLSSAFFGATAFNGTVNGWDVSGVTTMNSCFASCTNFNQSLSTWDTSSCTDMAGMFGAASAFDQDISGFDTGSVTTFVNMFENATAFDQDIGGWDVTALTNATNMFNLTSISTANYDALLVGWEAQAVNNSVVFNGGSSTYTSAGAGGTARAALIADHSWTITDGGGV